MTGHVTWLGERRTVGVILLALVAVGLVPVLSRGLAWCGSWKMALAAGAFSLTLIGPVAAGIAATVYARFATSGVEHLVPTAPRPWWPWLRPALAIWCLGAATMLALVLGVTTTARLAGAAPYYDTLWVVLPALCVLAAQVGVGVLLGGAGRRLWLAPVAAAATFGLGVLGAVGVMPEIFRTGGLGATYAGETFDASTLALQAGAGLGIAAALLALSNVTAVWSTPAARGVVGLLVLVGVVSYAVLGNGVHEPYRAVSDPELVCRGDAPRVCMARETTRPLGDLARRMRRQAVALTDLGVALPARYVQPQPGRDTPETDGELLLLAEQELAAEVPDETAAASLVTPAACAAYRSDTPPPEASFDSRRLLARWLLVRAGALEPDRDDADRAWLASAIEEQRPWVRSTFERLRACDLGALRLPEGV